jgi:hypothetical protein
MYLATAQINKAVLKPQILRRQILRKHGEGHLFSDAEHLESVGGQLHLAGRQLGIYILFGTIGQYAVKADDRLLGEVRDGLLESAIRVDDHLRKPVVVAQINKQHAPMVAAIVNPPAEPNELPNIAPAKLPAIMGTIPMRFLNSLFRIDDDLLT